MLKSEAAAYLAGVTQTEGAEASAPTNLHVITGEVGEASADGKTLVKIDGLMFSESDDQFIEVDALGGLEEGDIATIVLTGEQGHAMTPLALGSIGSVDRITVRIAAIEADYIKVEQLDAAEARIGDLEADHVSVDDLNAATARIGTLETTRATITDLEAATARIGDLEADHVSTDDLNAATARIGTLEADHVSTDDLNAAKARIGTLETNTADIGTIRANSAKVQNLTAAELEADHATVGSLSTNYAHITNGVIDNATIGYADVNNLSAHYAEIQNGKINSALIDTAAIVDEQVFTVTGNKATLAQIDASKINVLNLKAKDIEVERINGQPVTNKTLVDALSQHESDISDLDSKIDDEVEALNDRIDGAIETFTGTVVPTLENTPASQWNTVKLKDQHVGDVYYVVNSQSAQNGYCYRFTKSGSTYSWQLIKDSDVTAALSRLQTAEGKISNIETFDETVGSFMTNTDDELSSLKAKDTQLETSLGDKVSTSTFNTVSQKVDANEANITSMSTVLTNNGLTSSTNITNTVNTVKQTADTNKASITSLTQTVYDKADNSTVTTLTNRVSSVEQDLSGYKTTVSETYATQTALATTNGNVTAAQTAADNAQAAADRANGRQVAYSATSSTGASTAAKVAACTNFPALAAGATVTVRFSAANTSTGAVTLNVNSTGAKTVYVNGAATSSSNQLLWGANANITFTYDGSYWRVDSEPRTWYGTGAVAAATAAKTATINEVVICKGTTVVLNMTNENTSTSATLNVTSTGAKNIYYGTTTTRPTTANGYGWSAGSTVSLTFDGQYWRIGDTTALSRLTAAESTISSHTTSISQNASAIALKADSSTTYTKTDVDGLISTEVTNRNAAITAKANEIASSVSETYATKTAVNSKADASDVTALAGRVTTAETNITQNTDAIALRATKTEVQQVRPAYASSSTAAGTAAKVATIDPAVTGYALYKGASVAVTFSKANTAATPTLNLNSTGAKQIRSYTGAALSEAEYKWAAGSTIDLVYDGTYWRMQDSGAVKRVTAAEASISINAENIESKVSKNGVISSINQSAESVKIQASRVEIDGTAVFSAISDDVDDAITSKGYATTTQAQGYATTAKSEAISAAATDATTKANAAETNAKAYTDSLEVGGRNLLYDTSDWSKWAKTAKATATDNVLTCTNTDTSSGFQRANGWFIPDKVDVMDREIVISFDVKKTDSTELSSLVFQMFTTSAAPRSVASGNINEGTRYFCNLSAKSTSNVTILNASEINATTWTRVSIGFVPSQVFNTTYTEQAYLAVYVGISNKVASAQFRHIKAEYGNKATDWTPAPEDQTAYVDAVQVGGRNLLQDSDQVLENGSVLDTKTLFACFLWSTPAKGYTGYKQIMPYTNVNSVGRFALTFEAMDVSQEYWCIKHNGTQHDYARYFKNSVDVKQGDALTLSFDVVKFNPSIANGLEIKNFKLERGNKATDWTPAPEDIEANAVKRTQRIWYRTNASSAPATPGTASSNWVTKADDGNDAWTKMHIAISSTHKYIYTCEQYEMANGTVGYTSVLLDNTITVIDGGNIITGSVTANKLNAANINASKTLTVGAMTDAAASTILNSNVQVGGRNLLTANDALITPTLYGAYDLYVTDPIESGQSYILQLWDVDVSHSAKTAAQLGVNVYYCGGSMALGGWIGTNYFTSGHADHLILYFTVYTSGSTVNSGGNISGSANVLSHSSVTNTTKKYIRLYNSVPSVEGTRNMTVGSWKLEKGNKATDWTPAPEDMATADSLAGTNESLEGAITDIGELSDQLVGTVSEQNKTITDIQKYLNSLRQDLDAEIQSRQQWLNFNSAEGLIIGATGSTFKTVTTNTSQQFRSGGTILAETSGTEFVAPVMRSDQLLIGNWMWTRRDNGNLSLKWIG